MTKLLLTSIAALFLATGTAHAANITWEWNENIQSPIIFIRGKLVDEDVTTFKSALGEIAEGSGTANKRIWVDLISPGGAISAGLNIGGLIAYYGMGTVVAADKSQCLWLVDLYGWLGIREPWPMVLSLVFMQLGEEKVKFHQMEMRL